MSSQHLFVLGGMRGRMFLVTAVPLCALVVAAIAITAALRPVEQATAQLVDTDLPVTIHGSQLQLSITQTLLHTRGAMIESEPAARDKILAAARETAARAELARNDLNKISVEGSELAAKHSAIKSADATLAALSPIWEKLGQNSVLGTDEALELAAQTLPSTMAALDAAMKSLTDARDEAIEHSVAASKANIAQIRSVVVFAPALGLVVSVAVGAWLASSLIRKTRTLCERLHAIAAGHGRLESRTISLNDRHELGLIARSFNEFAGSIRDIVSRVDSMTTDVSAATSQIAAATEESAASMNAQNEQVRQVSQAVTQMSEAAGEVARQSTKATEIARSAGEAAKAGNTVVERTLESMTAIGEAVSKGVSSVQSLGQRSQQIGKIIEVIDDIADQTNLLALNAAIEAARAGSHGAGFAVVADEVRKLADRTTQATSQVAQSIREIQQETLAAVEQMNAGQQQVKAGAANANEARESLRRIVASVDETASVISGISAAAIEQAAASDQARGNLEEISQSVGAVQSAVSDTAQAAVSLRDKSEGLRRELTGFIADHA